MRAVLAADGDFGNVGASGKAAPTASARTALLTMPPSRPRLAPWDHRDFTYGDAGGELGAIAQSAVTTALWRRASNHDTPEAQFVVPSKP